MFSCKAIDSRFMHRDDVEIAKARFAIRAERLRQERRAHQGHSQASGDQLPSGLARKIENGRSSEDIEEWHHREQISWQKVQNRERISLQHRDQCEEPQLTPASFRVDEEVERDQSSEDEPELV